MREPDLVLDDCQFWIAHWAEVPNGVDYVTRKIETGDGTIKVALVYQLVTKGEG